MRRLLLLVVLMPVGVAGAAGPRCVLPDPDGKVQEPSPASLAGVILRVELPRVLIRTADEHVVSVLIEKDTKLFTSYGGGLDDTQLGPGQSASVWLRECAPASVRTRHAAVLTVCSLSPEPCAKQAAQPDASL